MDSSSLRGAASKYFLNPIAPGPLSHGPAPCVREARADASIEERLENSTLRDPRVFSTRSAAARILHRQMKRGGAGFVSDRRIGAGRQQALHGGGTSRPYRAMERSGPVRILCIDPGSR